MYKIILKKKAKKFIDKLPKDEQAWVVRAIMSLPNGFGSIKSELIIEMLLIMCYSGFRIRAFEHMEVNLEERFFRAL